MISPYQLLWGVKKKNKQMNVILFDLVNKSKETTIVLDL